MSLVHEIDFGTPRSKSEAMVTLTIDGQTVTVPEGTSIMRAAMEMGTQIPKLCATDMVDAFGSCRLCLVEIEGRAGTPASCTTPVAPGIVAKTSDGGANDKWLPKDESNPYFTYDPSKCIVCSRCVRACEEQQGTFALTIQGRGFESKVSPSQNESFMDSECVSCGACVQACPT